MGQNETDILGKVVDKTDNGIILALVVFAVVIVAIAVLIVSLYKTISDERKNRMEADRASSETRQDKYIEREREIIKVVTANTEVMAELKTTLEKNGDNTSSAISQISGRIDVTASDISKIKSDISRLAENQKDIEDNTRNILLIVDSMPHASIAHKASN